MKRHVGQLLTTSPDAMSAFDEWSYHRVVEWAGRPEEIKMQYKENDNALLEFVNTAPLTKNTIKNPVVHFRIDGALANYTVLTTDLASDGVTVYLEDASITAAGHTLIVVGTGEELYVSAINATANTATVERNRFGPAFSALSGAEIRVGAPYIGETGTMKDAHTTYPGDPAYNYITLSGLQFKMSTMQINAAMEGEWGTFDKYSMDTKYQVESLLQNALLFQHRHTEFDADESQIYRGAGLIQQLSGSVLDLGDKGTNFLWEHLNDFINPMFASDLSADSKEVYCGHKLWADALSSAKQMAPDCTDITIDAKTGARMFTISTTEGKTVTFKRVGGFEGELASIGLVLDGNNIGGSQYDGLGPQWFFDLQDPGQVLVKEHAYFTSWETHVYDRSTMGLIRGGTNSLIA